MTVKINIERKDWLERMYLTPTQVEIQKIIDRFDAVSFRFESRWGIGRLFSIIDEELKRKWDSQIVKINNAIETNDLNALHPLVEGAIRGWAALESNAISLGYNPLSSNIREVKHPESGKVYRFVLDDYEAKQEEGKETFTLLECARIIEAHYSKLNDIKSVFPDCKITSITNNKKEKFNWKKGDELPF